MRRLEARALALEWSHDEVGAIVDRLVETGQVDLDALWRVPSGGDLFAGDGRFTAGHVAVLQHLLASRELERVVLLDRLDAEGPERELDMAARLLESLDTGARTIAVVGFFHASREATSMLAHVERARPGVASGALAFSSGTCHYRGERAVRPSPYAADAVFELGAAAPAVVPAK